MRHRAIASLIASSLLLANVPAAGDDDPYDDPPEPNPADDPCADSSQPKPTPDDPYADLPQIKTAQPRWIMEKRRAELYTAGQKLVGEGRWNEAIEKLREVTQIRSHPRVLLWMGFPEERLCHLLEARKLYSQAKEEAEKLKLKQEQKDAETALTALTPKIPHLVIRLPKGPDAVVVVDSVAVTLEGERWDVNPGKHRVFVAWPDRQPFQTEVVVRVGEAKPVDVALSPLPLPPRPCPPPPPPPPPVPPRPKSCGCRVGSASEPFGGLAALALLGLSAALAARRRQGE